MDFFKVDDNPIKSYETNSKGKSQKKEEAGASFSEILASDNKKRIYDLPKIFALSTSSGEDKATISESARTAYELFKLVNIVKKSPDIREAEIAHAKDSLEKGFSDPRIDAIIAERILNIFLPR
ncbi:MAG: hypothetical protein QME07_01675 [bacterium]|nr:hypothetical protein [bacterium]